MASDPDLDGSAPWPHHISSYGITRLRNPSPCNSKRTHPYSPSIASTASSSSDSVFSVDAPSSQSSASSAAGWSSSSDRSSWIDETENTYLSSGHAAQHGATINEEVINTTCGPCPRSRVEPPVEVVALESRQHPRRTQRLNSFGSQYGNTTAACPRPPPSLVRQSERKDNFVDSLVDTTTQMIETIWPLSIVSCSRDIGLSGKQQNLIGLRTFVQEVLRRSKTSYSTLQVALYYLILIQSCIPKHDFTMEQSEDSSACRAMQCGRRMFLAALILASKYLQDRNYSARAWSKISGLRTCEINTNELAFLSAVNWKLHVPEPVFHRWTDIVMRYSPARVNAVPRSVPVPPQSWKTIVPLLTPELDTVEFGSGELSDDSGYNSPGSEMSDMSPPPIPIREELTPRLESDEPTPTNPYTIPRTLEPTPRDSKADENILPPLPHLGPLPTPQMTPQTGAFCTPAVSVSGLCSGRSMSFAMTQIQNTCLARSTLDNPHQWKPNAPAPFPTSARRSSLARSISSVSSPESMISDVSSRSSRSSSISSVASSNCALPPPRLAVQATRRCANMQLSGLKEENQKPMPIDDGSLSWGGFSSSAIKTRCVQSPVSYEPEHPDTHHSESTREAAAALRDLALNCQHPNTQTQPVARPQKGRKRSRPNSMDLSVQSSVRDLIAPRCLGNITNKIKPRNGEDSKVLPDAKLADSFLVPKSGNSRPSSSHSNTKPALSGECLPRKRTCAGSDRGGREEARLMMQKVKERDGMARGPGMWEGII